MNNTPKIHELDVESRREYMRLNKRLSRLKARAAAAGAPVDYVEVQKLKNQMQYVRNKQRYKDKAKIWNQRNPVYMRAYAATDRVKKHYPETWSRSSLTFENMMVWLEANMDQPCSYCGEPSDAIDHVIPLSAGGEHSTDNIVRCCFKCNSNKAAGSLDDMFARVSAMYTTMSNNFPHLVK